MSQVRVLVGTRKGAFILTSDGKRNDWKVSGPHFAGWEIYHLKGSTADPNRIYASQTSGWFGQVLQRSDDGGKTWFQPGTPPGETTGPGGQPKGESNKFLYDASPATGKPLTTHMWYDGTQHPWEFKRVWHLEPSLTDPDTVYAGVEDAALFKSTDGGISWHELSGLRGHGTGPKWQPGAGGMCLHTILLDPKNPDRIYIAISAAGAFRTDDGGKTWTPINRGLISQFIPDPNAEVGHCVHHVALHPSKPDVLFMQKHWDVMRSDNAGDAVALKSAAIFPPISVSSLTSTPTNPKPSTSYPLPATASTTFPKANSASTAAVPAATNGNPSPRASRSRIATSTFFATPWPSTRSTPAASTSAPLAARSTSHPTPATPGPPSSRISQPFSPSKSKPSHDPRHPTLRLPCGTGPPACALGFSVGCRTPSC